MNTPGILCLSPPGVSRLARYKFNVWPEETRKLHVLFMDGDPFQWRRIADWLLGDEGWSAACGMEFVFDQQPNAQIRVTLEPGGCWSHVGNYPLPLDRPTMQLGWVNAGTRDEEVRRVTLHEFGHALGFIHEHQQPNAHIPWNMPVVVEHYRRIMGWTEEMTIGQVIAPVAPEAVDAGVYDRTSVMHYSFPADFVTDPAFVAPFNTHLSAQDREMAAHWYGPPSVPPRTRTHLPVVFG